MEDDNFFSRTELSLLDTEVEHGEAFYHSLRLRLIGPIKFELGLGHLTGLNFPVFCPVNWRLIITMIQWL